MAEVSSESKQPLRSKLAGIAGSILIVAGLLLTLAVAGLYSYRYYEDWRFAQERQQYLQAFEAERAALEAQRQAEEQRAALAGTPLPSFQTKPTPGATPAAGAVPGASPAGRIIIPSIDVDSQVVESQVKNGEWQVPKFVVGHLQGTANPGGRGNAVFSGHIQSISSGNVFARLGELRVGDRIYLQTADSQYVYEVSQTKVVANTDVTVVKPTADPTITLITCTGTWDFRTRDYLQRLIIVGKLYQDKPPTKVPLQPR